MVEQTKEKINIMIMVFATTENPPEAYIYLSIKNGQFQKSKIENFKNRKILKISQLEKFQKFQNSKNFKKFQKSNILKNRKILKIEKF